MEYRNVRKYLYTVLAAAGPVVVFYGLADSNEVALWLGLGGTILGLPSGGVALANLTPPAGEYEVVEYEGEEVDLSEDAPKHAA